MSCLLSHGVRGAHIVAGVLIAVLLTQSFCIFAMPPDVQPSRLTRGKLARNGPGQSQGYVVIASCTASDRLSEPPRFFGMVDLLLGVKLYRTLVYPTGGATRYPTVRMLTLGVPSLRHSFSCGRAIIKPSSLRVSQDVRPFIQTACR